MVFVDQSGINLAMSRTRARSPKGQRAVAFEPKQHAKNLTVIGALGALGMHMAEVISGGMKKPHFIAFMTALLATLNAGQIIVLDNLRIHHAAEIKAMAKAAGVYLLFTPPYSPEFNPIEEAWSKFKALLRKLRARTPEALKSAVEIGLDNIKPKDAVGWTRHAGYPVAEAQGA